MPYKSEKIKLSEEYDRRIKLTSAQKKEIKERYETENTSQRKLAKEYNVSKSLIGIIVNPERAAKLKQRSKDHWMDYKYTKEEWREIQKEHRHYKQKLYKEGKIK